MSSYRLDELQRGQCVTLLDDILESPEIVAAVLETADGPRLAASNRDRGVDTFQVAALSAMLISLGNSLTGSRTPASHDVAICDLKGSPMVVLPAGKALLSVIGRKGANMGLVVGIARNAAPRLAEIIARAPIDRPREEKKGFVFDADGFTARVLKDVEERKHGLPEGGL
ncbi:MAG TPA: hypothetical protein VNI58_10860 [Mariprofundaceae bacterium]|nr:hypothetical protein [Mariprofundaceae bacterium]